MVYRFSLSQIKPIRGEYMIKVPCLNCNCREISCHSYCKKYKEYKKLKAKEQENRNKERARYGYDF